MIGIQVGLDRYHNPYEKTFASAGIMIGFSNEAVITNKYEKEGDKIFEVDINGDIQKVKVKTDTAFSKEIGEKVDVLSLKKYDRKTKDLLLPRDKDNNVLKSEVKRGVDYIYDEDTGKVTNLAGDILKK